MENLSYIDIGIIVLLILLSIKGIWQGIIRGLASFLGIVCGVFFASRFYSEVGVWFAQTIYDLKSAELNALIGFLIIIMLIWGVCLLLGEVLYRFLRFTPIAALDGAFGLIFGFAKAFLLLSIVVFGVSQIGWLKNFSQNIEQNSSLYPMMKHLAIEVMNLGEVEEVKSNLDSLKKDLEGGAKNLGQSIGEAAKEAIDEAAEEIKSSVQGGMQGEMQGGLEEGLDKSLEALPNQSSLESELDSEIEALFLAPHQAHFSQNSFSLYRVSGFFDELNSSLEGVAGTISKGIKDSGIKDTIHKGANGVKEGVDKGIGNDKSKQNSESSKESSISESTQNKG